MIGGGGKLFQNFVEFLSEPSNIARLLGFDKVIFYSHYADKSAYEIKLDELNIRTKLGSLSLECKVLPSDSFGDFYRQSSVILFSPGKMIAPFVDKSTGRARTTFDINTSNNGNINEMLYHAMMADFREVYEGIYSDTEKYNSFVTIMTELHQNPHLRLGYDNNHKLQMKFLNDAYKVGNLEGLLRDWQQRSDDKSISEEQMVTLEAFNIVMDAKKQGMFPYGLRLWECFAPSIKMILDYGKLFRSIKAEPHNDPKPIIVATNESNMACNMLSIMYPKLTPYLVGFMDFDSRRMKMDFINLLELDEVMVQTELDKLSVGVVGDHDCNTIPVFDQATLNRFKKFSTHGIYNDIKNKIYSYVSRMQRMNMSHNVEVNESLVAVLNAANASLGNVYGQSSIGVVGSFFDSIFSKFDVHGKSYSMPAKVREALFISENNPLNVDYKSIDWKPNSGTFVCKRHGFYRGMVFPLDVGLPSDKVLRGQILNEYKTSISQLCWLTAKLITNPVIRDVAVVSGVSSSIYANHFPYVGKPDSDQRRFRVLDSPISKGQYDPADNTYVFDVGGRVNKVVLVDNLDVSGEIR
ncbi:MAG: hypothetical protein ABIG89_03670 [Candidatus Woesearchaeota archaeon]